MNMMASNQSAKFTRSGTNMLDYWECDIYNFTEDDESDSSDYIDYPRKYSGFLDEPKERTEDGQS